MNCTKRIKRITAFAVAAAMICSAVSGCSNEIKLSNPVAVDEWGDVDMDVALNYETDVDALVAELDAKEVDPTKPVSEHSSKKTLEVFNYLRENYGKNTLLGQQMADEKAYEDVIYYKEDKDLPAIKGFDMIFTTSSGDVSQIDRAIEWHEKSSGLVTFTWHWNVPKDIEKPNGGKAFYTDEITNFSLINAVTPGTKEYEQIIHDIDLVAIQLQRLEAADVPVLWRPLHEASGSWFWWGGTSRDGAQQESYLKLWYIIFDRLENYHELTNLIWVWNGQDNKHTVNPNTYDISGTDIYPNSENHSAQAQSFKALSSITAEGKMIALTECGYLPDPKDMRDSESMWLYVLPWCSEFICAVNSAGSIALGTGSLPSINTDRMSQEFLSEFLKDENVITWQKMPKWDNTEKNIPERLDQMIKFAEYAASQRK